MNATVKKFAKKNDINALIDLANGPDCDMRDDAELTLARHEATPPAVLVELFRIAQSEGLYDLMDAVLDNPNLPAFTNADRVLASA